MKKNDMVFIMICLVSFVLLGSLLTENIFHILKADASDQKENTAHSSLFEKKKSYKKRSPNKTNTTKLKKKLHDAGIKLHDAKHWHFED